MNLPRKKVAIQQPSPARAEGNLAENSVTVLNGMEKDRLTRIARVVYPGTPLHLNEVE